MRWYILTFNAHIQALHNPFAASQIARMQVSREFPEKLELLLGNPSDSGEMGRDCLCLPELPADIVAEGHGDSQRVEPLLPVVYREFLSLVILPNHISGRSVRPEFVRCLRAINEVGNSYEQFSLPAVHNKNLPHIHIGPRRGPESQFPDPFSGYPSEPFFHAIPPLLSFNL